MFAQLDDTIIAISSPPGVGVRGILRLSGPEALPIAAQVFTADSGEDLAAATGHTRLMGRLRIGAAGDLPAEGYVFRRPRSYTRQDVVELHTVGSPPVLSMLLDELVRAGARPAEAGEFTARAYFNGALDLTRVEGVAAIIHARNDSQLRASEALLHGGLSRRTSAIRERLIDLLALVEAQIDFVEEPIEFVSSEQVAATIAAAGAEIDALLSNAPQIERLEILPEVLLVGRPNAGKSSLLNGLTGFDRAIRSAVAGTTRDVLRVPLTVPGGEVMLADTAGIAGDMGIQAANSRSAIPGDDVSTLAEAATRRAAATADLVIAVLDAADDPVAALQELRETLPKSQFVAALNKIDLVPAADRDSVISRINNAACLAVSASTGEGIAALRDRIGEAVFSGVHAHGADVLALSSRQRTSLDDAARALRRAAEILNKSAGVMNQQELLAVEVRDAVSALSLLTGEVATEELLGRIFARFCIGK
jgi:tRNA modification GTPase